MSELRGPEKELMNWANNPKSSANLDPLEKLAHDFVEEFCGGSETVEEILLARLLATQSPDVFPLVKAVHDGFTPDPGTSDLDNEQPITVRMSLGEYRRAERLYYELGKL
jgi:hypothetical protein